MQTNLLKILACPKCKTDLSVNKQETLGEEVIKEEFTCSDCKKTILQLTASRVMSNPTITLRRSVIRRLHYSNN